MVSAVSLGCLGFRTFAVGPSPRLILDESALGQVANSDPGSEPDQMFGVHCEVRQRQRRLVRCSQQGQLRSMNQPMQCQSGLRFLCSC